MKSRFFISVSVVTSLFLMAAFFSACDKKNESTVTASAEEEKTLDAMKQFKKIGNESSTISALELVDESSNSLPQVVATVNNVEITNKGIKTALQRFKVQVSHQKQTINKDIINKVINQFLEAEIQRELLFQQGKDLKIEVSNEDVTKMIDMVKSRFNSEEEFLNEFSKRGLTLEMLKEQFSHNIIVSKLIQKEIHDKIEISNQQAIDFYKKNEKGFINPESVHAAHILIKVDSKMSDEDKKTAKNKINDILKKAKGKEDFAKLAEKYSEGPSASRGGDLNYVTRGEMVKEFEDAVFKLNEGEISGVVETQFGYHIIKAYKKKEAGGLVPFDEVKKNILNFLKRSEAEEKTKTYIENLEKKADIKKFI